MATPAKHVGDDVKNSEEEMPCAEDEAGGTSSETNQQGRSSSVYLPGDEIGNDEELVCDESAYLLLHHAQTGAPCLSFDVIPDDLGEGRSQLPMTAYLVAGTQAEKAHANSICVLKMSNLHKTQTNKGSDDDDDKDGEDNDKKNKPHLDTALIKHKGGCNRIRCTQIESSASFLAASWSDMGKVNIYDLTRAIAATANPSTMKNFCQNSSDYVPIFTFTGHQTEGFSMDWSPTVPGKLLTGDNNKNIHMWTMVEDSWNVDHRPYCSHTAAVEDLQWSPNESTVFASCSVDKSIKIWDCRALPSKACMLTVDKAHDTDVNVINWNKNDPFIVSGGDDGLIKVWDLRQFQEGKSVAVFKHHTAPITSVEWHPSDSTVFAASGADDQVTQWDLAVERNDVMEQEQLEVPPQLLFIHQGQTDIKELHWHRQIPGLLITTAANGFNIFKSISVADT